MWRRGCASGFGYGKIATRISVKTGDRNIYSCDRDNGVAACGGRNPIWVQPDSSYVVSGCGNLDVIPDAGSLLASSGEYEGVQGT